ncbi:MAG: hypothetical protein HY553_22090 [Elusimicrobia bacterium]|nr:hypothetical protein [Elusimicrobiota bacterium]
MSLRLGPAAAHRLGGATIVLGLAVWAAAADPAPSLPRVLDMVLTGQAGTARSTVSRSLIKVGNYLYVSGEPGMQTIDVSNPDDLRLTSDWPNSSYKMNGAAVKGNVLYVTNWHPAEGLVLFDISNPARPAHLRTIGLPNYSWSATVTGDLLDLGLGNETQSIIQTYNISDPRNPRLVGQIVIDDRIAGNPTRHGDLMYITHKKQLYVYDVKDAARPRRLRTLDFDGTCGGMKVYRGYLYMLQFQAIEPEVGGLRVFSLEDPANPRALSFWRENRPRTLHFQGERLYVPGEGNQIFTLDVANPASPKPTAVWTVEWPGAGHGGYPVTIDGSGKYVYVGTTGGNNRDCGDFRACAHFGGRVYSVQVSHTEPPPAFTPAPRGVSGAAFVRLRGLPAVMAPGQEAVVSITMRNTGRAAWSSAQGYKLGAQGPADNAYWRIGRVGLAREPVAPGAERTFTFRVRAPARPGTYPFQWRMVAERSEWFGQLTRRSQVVVRSR